jgi:site-specific DNA recombinase
MNVVIYARVSTKEQEKEGFSIPAQLKLLHEYAERKGFQVVREYTDAETAKKVGRTSFQLMLEEIRQGKANILLVEKTDRLTRNFKDYVEIDDLINTHGLEVHLVKEGEVLGPNAKSHTKFIHGIKVVLAKNYIDNLSDEVKKGMYEKAEQGHFPSMAPYGYRNNRETRLIDVDEARAPFVRRAFDLYASGNYSLNQVRERLLQEGFCFREKRPKINKSSLELMLKNIFYTGDFIMKGKFYKGKHTPLISLAMFERVQEVFDLANKPKLTKKNFVFSGLMTCEYCGCSITSEIKKGRYVYYHCTNGRGKCENSWAREEAISEQFEAALKRIRLSEEDLQWIIPMLKSHHKDEISFHQDRVQELQRRQSKLLNRTDLIYEDKLDGKITEELWQRKHAEYKQELKQVEESLRQHQKGKLDYVENGIKILELARDAHSRYLKESDLEKRRILNFTLSNSTLKAGKLSYTYTLPFEMIAKYAALNKWWAVLDSNQ